MLDRSFDGHALRTICYLSRMFVPGYLYDDLSWSCLVVCMTLLIHT